MKEILSGNITDNDTVGRQLLNERIISYIHENGLSSGSIPQLDLMSGEWKAEPLETAQTRHDELYDNVPPEQREEHPLHDIPEHPKLKLQPETIQDRLRPGVTDEELHTKKLAMQKEAEDLHAKKMSLRNSGSLAVNTVSAQTRQIPNVKQKLELQKKIKA